QEDRFGTTIEYRHFRDWNTLIKDAEVYIGRHFTTHNRSLPDMSPLLLKKFREGLQELIINAIDHSESRLGVFACGQLFPKINRLDFTIADMGIGIHGRFERAFGKPIQPIDAIRMAISGKFTTRPGRPGGLGLSGLRKFIELNRGRFIIVSGNGYFEEQAGQTSEHNLNWPFPGTAVTIEIKTDDKCQYFLQEEVYPQDIF
ncbi:MAG: ATP-binding protein, partial [Candidatus Sumerlaeota bacterium]